MSTRDFSWGKGGRSVWLTTYHPCSAETSTKFAALTYLEPLGPPRPVAEDLYFTLLTLLYLLYFTLLYVTLLTLLYLTLLYLLYFTLLTLLYLLYFTLLYFTLL